MKLIAHRGNLNGPNPSKENDPSYINDALKLGYDVEIDVWFVEDLYWLGHDFPQYSLINYEEFLLNPRLWVHAKNPQAYYNLLQDRDINVFWHTTEDFVLTSKGDLWTYPKKQLFPGSICVMPELGWLGDVDRCKAVCTDFVHEWKSQYK